MAKVRMLDGTVIDNVPDGISKEEFRKKLLENVGPERYAQMTGDQAPATGVQSAPRETEPERKGGIGEWLGGLMGLSPEEMQANREEAALSESKYTPSSWAGMGAPPNLGQQNTAAERQQSVGQTTREAIESGYDPEDYGFTSQEWDALTEEAVAAQQKASAARQEAASKDRRLQMTRRGTRPEEPQTGAAGEVGSEGGADQAGWWNFLKKAASTTPKQIGVGFELKDAAIERIKAQNVRIGQVYLDHLAASAQDPETGSEARQIIQEAAADNGMTPDQFARYSARMVDDMVGEEREKLDEFSDIIDEVQSVRPDTDNWFSHIGAMVVENAPQLGYIAAGIATRNPVVTMGLMGTDVYARTYASARQEGRTSGEAAQDAMAAAIIEGATEAVPVHRIAKLMRAGNKSKATKLLEGIGTEGAQEALAEASMIAYDTGIVGKDVTIGEAFARVRDAAAVGAVFGTIVTAPVAAFGDDTRAELDEGVKNAARKLQSVTMRMRNPNESVTRDEIAEAKKEFVEASQKRRQYLEEKLEAKKAKKEQKERKKMTPRQRERADAAKAQAEKDQSVKGELTEEDVKRADTIERAINRELQEEDKDAVADLLDQGYVKLSKAGTLLVTPAAQKRLKAVRDAQEAGPPAAEQAEAAQEEPEIEPVKYERPEVREQKRKEAEERELGPEIKPKKFTSHRRRKEQIKARVSEKITDEAVRDRIADEIVREEQKEEAYQKREAELEAQARKQRDKDYDKALKQQKAVDAEVAENLAVLDEKGVSGYQGTRLGDVLRDAYARLEQEEAKAKEQLKDSFWNKPVQGQLFDVGGALAKGTKDYANLVKVGALKIAKTGLKYSAWSADMIGEFGESIRPVLNKVFHDAKKRARDVMRLSHEKFQTGERKGELKYSPRQYAKPGQIRNLRRTLEKLAKEGEPGRMWYEKSGKEILRITGGNKSEARKLAGLLAIYSSGTSVGPNLTNALKMWSMYKGGDTKMPRSGTKAGRFSEQDKTALEWLRSDEADQYFVEKFGDKRFPFFQNLMREIDPENYELGQGATIDLWMMRAFGYDQAAPTTAQFAFATTEIKNLAEKMGWENQQAQAAVWVAIKARWEYIQKRAKERAVKEGLAEWVPAAKGKQEFIVVGGTRQQQIEFEKEIIGIFRDEALKASLKEIGKKLDDSKQDFADYMNQHYATISWEAEPSTKLGLPFADMPLEEKMAMQAEIADILTNPDTGREFIAEWLGLLGSDQFLGPGSWNMKVGAAVQNSVLAPPEHKTSNKKVKSVQASTSEAMDGYAAILGWLLKQDAVAWHRPFYANALSRSNGAEIVGPSLTPEQTLEFTKAIVEAAIEAGVPEGFARKWAPIVMDGKVRVLNFPDKGTEVPNRDFHKIIQTAGNKAGLSGTLEVFQSDGNMIENDWTTSKKGEDYERVIAAAQNPEIQKAFERAKRQFAKQIAEVHKRYQKKHGKPKQQEDIVATKVDRKPIDHFSQQALRDATAEAAGNSRTAIVSLTPNEFLALAEAGQDASKTKTVEGVLEEGGQFYSTPFLYMDLQLENGELVGVIAGHEGRHRARALVKRGMGDSPMPVRLVSREGGAEYAIRWSQDSRRPKRLYPEGSYFLESEGKFLRSGEPMPEIITKQVREERDRRATEEPDEYAFSMIIAEPAEIEVTYNESDEYEVMEENGEVFYTSDLDDALATARYIAGEYATVRIVDEFGDVMEEYAGKPERIPMQITKEKLTDVEIEDSALAREDFMRALEEVTLPNPLSSTGERILDQSVGIEVYAAPDGIWLKSIRAFETGKGQGGKGLRKVLELADQHGVSVKLSATPFGNGGLKQADLVNWYMRNGFVEMKGMSGSFVRHPQNPVASHNVFKRSKKRADQAKRWGVPKHQAERLATRFGERLGLENIKVVESVNEFPDEVYSAIVMGGYADTIQGLYHEDPLDGPTIYVVSGNMYEQELDNFGKPSVKQLTQALVHETIGHFGVRAMLGDAKYNRYMDAIRQSFPEEVSRRGKDLNKDVVGRRLAAEEVMAYLAQYELDGIDLTKKRTNLLDKIINEIKFFLGSIGLVKLSRNDMLTALMRAADFVNKYDQATLQKRALLVEKRRKADRAVLQNVAAMQAEGRELNEPPVNSDGTVDLYHFSRRPGITHTDPDKFGTGVRGAERKRMHDEGWVNRTYFGIALGQKGGYRVEQQFTGAKLYKAKVDSGKLYDIASDPDGLNKGEGITKYEKAIKDAGYTGYWVKQPGMGMVAAVFEPMAAQEVDGGIGLAMSTLDKARKEDPDLDRFFNKIGHGKNQRFTTMKRWWAEHKANLGRWFEIEVLDQFAGIRHLEEELGIFGDQSGYVSVRLSAGTDTMIRAALDHAVPTWKDGTVAMDETSPGLLQILAPIARDPDMLKAFEAFIVARRAKRLKKEGRERLFEKDEIAAAYRYIRKNKLYGLFRETAADMAEYKKRVLDFAQEAGLIDASTRPLWENEDHVPFYRVLANDKTGAFAATSIGRLGRVGKVIHRLKGSDRELKHPLESIVQNIGMLIEASVKNRAMADVVENFKDSGAITKAPQAIMQQALIPMEQIQDLIHEAGGSLDWYGQQALSGIQKLISLTAPTGDNVVSVQENGKKQYYYVHDTGLMRGLSGVKPAQWTELMRVLRVPKRVLTRSITLTPDFILKNWFRDMFHSMILARNTRVWPGLDSVRGWAEAIAEDETIKDMMSGGALFDAGYVNASDPRATNLAIRKALMGVGRHNVLDSPRKLARFYMRLANGAENAHRVAIYQKTLKKSGSRKQALFEARDIMDFSVRGANPIVRFLTETVPFWGARVQGLSRTGKGFKEQPFLTFLRGAPIVLASVALHLINGEDDRYKGLNDYEKRMYYHFFDVFEPGDHWRLPKPFEIGAVFSTIPETLTDYMISDQPDRGKVLAHSVYWIMREMLMLSPDIQTVNPIFELMINENRFTEAPILTDWEKRKDEPQQYSHTTNATVRELAQSMPNWAPDWARSPKQLEHLLQGYFGSMMDYALAASDLIYYKHHEDEASPPTLRWDETPFVKAFRREEYGKYDKYINEVYETLNEANKIYNAINDLKKEGDREGVREYREEYPELLYARKKMNVSAKQMSEINKKIRRIYDSTRMSPTEKREKIDQLMRRRSEIAERAYPYRVGGPKNRYSGGEVEPLISLLTGMARGRQVDVLLENQLPQTATLVNDMEISDEKLAEVSGQ